ncbi:MAG: ROK family protein [Candidatus Aegiribacteria sp.]|nr:ROK family protein [Candidatus Aegiribacteria sp.]
MSNSPVSGMHWGIDIGGTTTILGYLKPGGFVKAATLKTDPSSGPDSLLRKISKTIDEIDHAPCSAGVGIAGLVNRSEGVVVFSANLPGWKDYPIRCKLSTILNCPVVIDNDCSVFAIQAIESSSIPDSGLWLMITLGTGIGGTIIHDGNILYGSGFAGEFGHMTVEASGKNCPCGSKGCWERYAASGALSEYYRKHGNNSMCISPKEIAQLASMKQDAALKAFKEFGTWLGIGLANLYHCFSPGGVFIAGGLMGASEFFLGHAESEFNDRCRYSWNVNVLPSSSDAGAEGAAIMGRNTKQNIADLENDNDTDSM